MIALVAYWTQVKTFWKIKLAYNPKSEFLTVGGITILFFLISLAQFKLPHYINILIPLYSIVTAAYLMKIYEKSKRRTLKVLLGVQYFILSLVFIFAMLACFYVFDFNGIQYYLLLLGLCMVICHFCLKREEYFKRIITLSAYSSILLNVVLNLHFYPSLLEYQAGSTMAEKVKERNIPVDNIYKISERHTWALDFYNQDPVNIATVSDLEQKLKAWVYATDDELQKLRAAGYHWHDEITVDQFRITRLQLKFLNPLTRADKLNKMHLVHLD